MPCQNDMIWTKVETIYILEKHELPSQRLKLISEKTVSFNEFKKKNGQLLYLENLKNSDFGKKGGGENPEPCPICQKSLGNKLGPKTSGSHDLALLSLYIF